MSRSRQVLSRRLAPAGVLMTVTALIASPGAAADDDRNRQGPGETNTITDVPGIKVGHETRTTDGYHTGTTVILAEGGATTGYSQQGGLPGTILTDLLEPGSLVDEAQAVVLTGGSAYGLDTTTGVNRWLEEREIGFPVDGGVVPIVPGAILFDLGRFGSDFSKRPDAEFGYLAADSATDGPVEIGRVGAGTGARVGLGSASVKLSNGYTVGAVAAVNPVGSPVNPDTCVPYGLFLELDNEFNLRQPSRRECTGSPHVGEPSDAPFNTTIVVVATDAPLDQAEAERMAMTANGGLARSVRPAFTLRDGDTVFAMATTTPPAPDLEIDVLQELFDAAADVVGRAVVHAVIADDAPSSYCNQYPSACRLIDRTRLDESVAHGEIDSSSGGVVAAPLLPWPNAMPAGEVEPAASLTGAVLGTTGDGLTRDNPILVSVAALVAVASAVGWWGYRRRASSTWVENAPDASSLRVGR